MGLTAGGLSDWVAEVDPPLLSVTVGEVLAERARDHPQRLALVATADDGSPVRTTYEELHRQARQAARVLLSLVGPGGRVALWAPNVAEWPVLEYGAMLAGVVLVAVNPTLRAPGLAAVLDHSAAPVLVHAGGEHATTVSQVVREGRPSLRRCLSLTEWNGLAGAQADADAPLPGVDPTGPAMLQYTSGTTGSPKGVVLSQHAMLNNARLVMEVTGVRAGAVCVSPMPMFHTAGCITCTLGPLWVGGTQVVARSPRPAELLGLLTAEHATVLFHTPAILRDVLDLAAAEGRALPVLDAVMGGAALVPPDLVADAERAFSAAVHNLYGMTELSSVATLVGRDQSREDKAQTVGRPLPHLDVRVVDPATAQVLPVGAIGELVVRGYQTFLEYLDDPAATAAARDGEGWVRTGDLATMDATGTVVLAGRLKELIIRGGENVSPAEVEAALMSHDAVVRAAVVGLPDARLGEVLAAVLHVLPGREPGVVAELEKLLTTLLPRYKVPQSWYASDRFPVTETGKLQRFRLRSAIETGELRRLDPEPVADA